MFGVVSNESCWRLLVASLYELNLLTLLIFWGFSPCSCVIIPLFRLLVTYTVLYYYQQNHDNNNVQYCWLFTVHARILTIASDQERLNLWCCWWRVHSLWFSSSVHFTEEWNVKPRDYGWSLCPNMFNFLSYIFLTHFRVFIFLEKIFSDW